MQCTIRVTIITLVMAVSGLVTAASQVMATPEFQYEQNIVNPGKGTFGELPKTDIDIQGQLYVTDNTNSADNGVDVFTNYSSGNTFVTKITGHGDPQPKCSETGTEPPNIENAFSVTADPSVSQGVYILDSKKDRVLIFDGPSNNYKFKSSFCTTNNEIAGLNTKHPSSLKAYQPSHLYLAASEGDNGIFGMVSAIDIPQKKVTGSLAMPFSFPFDLSAADNGFLYVSDFLFGKVRIYKRADNPDGTVLFKPVDDKPLGQYSSGSSAIVTGVAADSLGRVYISESYSSQATGGGRVTVFSSYANGFQHLITIEGVQTEEGFKQFTGPTDIEIDGTRIYVADRDTNGVWKLRFDDVDADGQFDIKKEDGIDKAEASRPLSLDSSAPSSRVKGRKMVASKCKKRKRLCRKKRTTSLHSVFGSANDDISGIANVYISIGRKLKKGKCQWLGKAKLLKSNCAVPAKLTTKLTNPKATNTNWKIKLSVKQRKLLKKGKWRIISSAVDQSGNIEAKDISSKLAKPFKVK